MPKHLVPIFITVGFSLVGVIGDFCLKHATQAANPFKTAWFYAGFIIYASTAFGWLYVMRHLKLGTIGVVYSISMILMLTAIGVVGFKETLSAPEVVGLAMAVGSLILLVRFA